MGDLAQPLQPKRRALSPVPARVAEGLRIDTGDHPSARLLRSTPHFRIYVDPELGADGITAGEVVLARCEADYATIAEYFGGIALRTLPTNVIIADLRGLGAYHTGDSGSNVYCAVKLEPRVAPRFTEFVLVTQLVELFEEAQDAGWHSESSNGESLSRVLATALYPGQLTDFASAYQWLDSEREDFVNTSTPSDANSLANGCGVLFLNYLHHYLGYGWREIVLSASGTLAGTYSLLTGDAGNPFPAFSAILLSLFPAGMPAALTSDNPFPPAGRRAQGSKAMPHPPHMMMPLSRSMMMPRSPHMMMPHPPHAIMPLVRRINGGSSPHPHPPHVRAPHPPHAPTPHPPHALTPHPPHAPTPHPPHALTPHPPHAPTPHPPHAPTPHPPHAPHAPMPHPPHAPTPHPPSPPPPHAPTPRLPHAPTPHPPHMMMPHPPHMMMPHPPH